MTDMHISMYMLVCAHDIFINICNIFFNFFTYFMMDIFTHMPWYRKFLHGFSVPDVSSSVISVSSVVSVVLFVSVMVGDDTTSHKMRNLYWQMLMVNSLKYYTDIVLQTIICFVFFI